MEKKLEELNLIKYKSSRLYRASYKVGVIMDLVMHQESDAFIARKHGLSTGFMAMLKKELLEQHGYFRILEVRKKEDQTTSDLGAENARLRKALELSTLKVAALETLIDVAEDQFNVDIRKKAGSKQSK